MAVVEEEQDLSPNWTDGFYIDGDPVPYEDVPPLLREWANDHPGLVENPAGNVWLKQRATNPTFYARKSGIGTTYKLDIRKPGADGVIPLTVYRVRTQGSELDDGNLHYVGQDPDTKRLIWAVISDEPTWVKPLVTAPAAREAFREFVGVLRDVEHEGPSNKNGQGN